MKVLSLFDGISCARIALERVGIEVENYYASEVNKYAIQVSQKNYPDIVQIGDVKKIEYKYMKGSKNNEGYYLLGDPDRPLLVDTMRKTDIDLLIGGSPCQDLSIAKKDRKGLDGERSGLFRDYVRILREVKPKYFILENVASMSKEARDIITQELGVEPIMINASLVSAQNRKRLFWTNIPNVTLPEDKGIVLKDIIEKEVDEKYYISSEVFEKLKKFESNARLYSLDGKCCTLNTMQGGHRQPKILENTSFDYYNNKIVPNNKAKTLGTNPQSITAIAGQLVNDGFAIRKLTPIECERLQGVPDNYTEGVSNTQRYKTLGNAFNVDVVAHILSFIPK